MDTGKKALRLYIILKLKYIIKLILNIKKQQLIYSIQLNSHNIRIKINNCLNF